MKSSVIQNLVLRITAYLLVIQNLILRIVAFLLLLTSLIVMLRSKTSSVLMLSGRSLDYHFKEFKPLRFVVAANGIGCAYSFIQIIKGLAGLSAETGFYLNFICDQVMAYIVLASASAGIACIMLTKEILEAGDIYDAAAQNFMRYASASVSVEVVGFVVVAACALMSAYSLFCYLNSSTINSVPANIDTKQQGGVA